MRPRDPVHLIGVYRQRLNENQLCQPTPTTQWLVRCRPRRHGHQRSSPLPPAVEANEAGGKRDGDGRIGDYQDSFRKSLD